MTRVATILCRSVLAWAFVSSFFAFSSAVHAEGESTLFFHSSEVSVARNTVLKGTIDQYLKTQGESQFQPVKEQAVFEALLLSKSADALLMSSYHFEQLVKKQPELKAHYVPVLQGEKNGSDIYFNLLVSANEVPDFNGRILASSRNEALTLSLLGRTFPNLKHKNIKELNVLEVPKDIDALMAVGFGLADLALANDGSLATLTELYEEQYGQVHIVGKSKPQKRMIVILSNSILNTESSLGEMVYSMPQSLLGKRAMKLLGLDSWRWLVDGTAGQGGRD